MEICKFTKWEGHQNNNCYTEKERQNKSLRIHPDSLRNTETKPSTTLGDKKVHAHLRGVTQNAEAD